MRRLIAFTNISVDGYIADAAGSMAWAKDDGDAEFAAFTQTNARSDSLLLFGRTTYELMAGFWPGAQAQRMLPEMAARMNALPKVVFSSTLPAATWNNTALVRGDLPGYIRLAKAAPGPDMVILRSGSLITQLSGAGAIDEYQLVVTPILLGAGKSLAAGIASPLNLALTSSRTFANGKVLLCYSPR
jgi:dihydrofolate reductase